jgi:hypothetical protein
MRRTPTAAICFSLFLGEGCWKLRVELRHRLRLVPNDGGQRFGG